MSTTTTTTTAAHGLSLRPLQDGHGLAVVGHPHTTYKHRRELREHGARWNATRRQWEATTPHDCDTLRRWIISRQDNGNTQNAHGCTPYRYNTAPTLAGMFNPYL